MPTLRALVLSTNLLAAFSFVGCAGSQAKSGAAAPSPRVVITSHPVAAKQVPTYTTFRMSLAGEPWRSGAKTSPPSIELAATTMPSPATPEWRPWGTAPGARIITLTATRADDGRRFLLEVAVPAADAKAGDPLHAIAEYRTTQGTTWTASNDTCQVRLTRLERDDRGRPTTVSVAFDVELRTKNELRPLLVSGHADDVVIGASAEP